MFSWFSNRLSREDAALRDLIPYDPETQDPVIRSSICTGEKVAGFKNRTTGRFQEIMLIRSQEDEARFKKIYQLDSIRIEY